MNTDKKKTSSFPAGQFTKDDIKALRDYVDELERLRNETPEGMLTVEEWDEAMQEISRTGKIPAKYEGRIAENEVTVYTDEVNGEWVRFPEGIKKKTYYDIAENAHDQKMARLTTKYHDSIVKAIFNAQGDEEGLLSVTDIIRELLKNPAILRELEKEAAETPEVMNISNLPNLLPTDKRLQYAMTPLRNDYAYIMPFNYEQLCFDYDENGEIIIRSEAQYKAVEEAKDEKKHIKAAGIDQPLLRQLFAATMKAYLCNYGNSITVYLPSFAREMNIDVSGANKRAEATEKGERIGHNANDFFKKLKALESLNGVWQGGSFYRVFVLEGYEAEQNTLTFSSPWLFKIARELLTTPANKKTRADGSIMWEITGISSLMKPSIVSARSKPTVEIIATLLVGLQQYGTKPEAERHKGKKYRDKELVEYKISFKTLIERIPLIMENLNTCTPSNKTTLLQRYFCGSNIRKRQKDKKPFILEEYIREYTLIPEYYKDFEIVFQPPTVKTLSEKVIIRHRGINGNFIQDNALNELLFQDIPQEESVVSPEDKG